LAGNDSDFDEADDYFQEPSPLSASSELAHCSSPPPEHPHEEAAHDICDLNPKAKDPTALQVSPQDKQAAALPAPQTEEGKVKEVLI